MKSSAKKVELASVDDLFSTEESRADAQREKVVEIPLSELHPFKGHWGRLHQSYLKLHRPMLYNELILSGRLHTVVADLNEQAADRLDLIIRQMMKAEGVTEAMKAENQMLWVQSMNSIRCRAEEIIKTELIYC